VANRLCNELGIKLHTIWLNLTQVQVQVFYSTLRCLHRTWPVARNKQSYMAKKNNFKISFKDWWSRMSCRDAGREFHAAGPTNETQRSPIVRRDAGVGCLQNGVGNDKQCQMSTRQVLVDTEDCVHYWGGVLRDTIWKWYAATRATSVGHVTTVPRDHPDQ